MRSPVLAALAICITAPMAAQTSGQAPGQMHQKVVFLSGDTLVTIERGDKNSCTVKLGDRTLSERQASDICAQKERSITLASSFGTLTDMDGVRSRLRVLSDSSFGMAGRLEALRGQEELLSKALTSEITREAFARQRELAESNLFGNLMRTQQGSIIGVTVDARPRETDRWGAYVQAVTPNYPADKAGIRVGDIITKVDGQSLTSGRTERESTPDESLVWLRLSEAVRKLEPGKPVDLEYRRNDRTERTRVTPIDDNRWFATTMAPSLGNMTPTPPGGDPARFFVRAPTAQGRSAISVAPSLSGNNYYFNVGGVIANLELAPMNEKLGSYFGTSRGVLVISAPEEQNLGLIPGDVITTVDGRTVTTPGELIRVLRTYDQGREFSLQVMRQKRQQTITTSLP